MRTRTSKVSTWIFFHEPDTPILQSLRCTEHCGVLIITSDKLRVGLLESPLGGWGNCPHSSLQSFSSSTFSPNVHFFPPFLQTTRSHRCHPHRPRKLPAAQRRASACIAAGPFVGQSIWSAMFAHVSLRWGWSHGEPDG